MVVHGVIAQYKLIFAVIQRGSNAHHNIDDAISDVAVNSKGYIRFGSELFLHLKLIPAAEPSDSHPTLSPLN